MYVKTNSGLATIYYYLIHFGIIIKTADKINSRPATRNVHV